MGNMTASMFSCCLALVHLYSLTVTAYVTAAVSRATKFDKVVRREVCSIQTKGTKRFSFIDGDATDGSNSYLLAVAERVSRCHRRLPTATCWPSPNG